MLCQPFWHPSWHENWPCWWHEWQHVGDMLVTWHIVLPKQEASQHSIKWYFLLRLGGHQIQWLAEQITYSFVNPQGNESSFYMDLVYTPKNPLCNKCSHFLIMPLSTEVLLDHIADYLLSLTDAPLLWFTINSSYDHPFHLSSWYSLSPCDYEWLLATANLAHYTK